jgi:hypothetical protein
MKWLLLLLLCAPALAADKRIENMAAHCKSVMDSGVCAVALDPKDYPNATIPIVLPTGVRRINKEVYLAVRATGFAKNEKGEWLMCLKVYEACKAWDSDACLAVRSLWRQK